MQLSHWLLHDELKKCVIASESIRLEIDDTHDSAMTLMGMDTNSMQGAVRKNMTMR